MIKKFLKDLLFGVGGTITIGVTAYQVAQSFGIDLEWLKNAGVFGIYLFSVHSLLIGLVYAFILTAIRQDWRSMSDEAGNENAQKLSIELTKIVEKSYKAKNYIDVVRFASQLSRPLWLSGMYGERIRIGQIIEDSASRVGMYDEQIVALIDDLGWTNAVTGNIDKAEKHIRDGIKLALDKQSFYYAAKGERHLAIISERYKENTPEAKAHFEEALRITEFLEDQREKQEMRAGILYGMAELSLVEGRHSEALGFATESKGLYEKLGGQEERIVKSKSQLGKIHLGLNEVQKAKDYFRAGLDEAQRMNRKDEIAINLLGLGEANFKEREFNLANQVLLEAIDILKETNMRFELKKAMDLEIRSRVEMKAMQD